MNWSVGKSTLSESETTALKNRYKLYEQRQDWILVDSKDSVMVYANKKVNLSSKDTLIQSVTDMKNAMSEDKDLTYSIITKVFLAFVVYRGIDVIAKNLPAETD